VCGGLLYLANSRASNLAAIVVVLVFTVALRHQRLLLQCAFVSLLFLTAMAVINPSQIDERVSSFTGRVIYKAGGSHPGAFGSRLSPWADTLSVVKRRPWFGSGFGTSELGDLRPDIGSSSVYTLEGTNREHGNSYLALAEYMGLLGSMPFVVLLFMLARMLVRTCRWMRRTGNPYHYCIPLALVAIAGLVHACFEDWLFAVGSYLCLFFWVSVFLLMDLAPELRAERRMPASKPFPAFAQPQAIRQPTT
jgi:O-antigen ligase